MDSMRIGISSKNMETDHTILVRILSNINKRIVDMMNFGEALEAMKLGYKVRRKPWDSEYLVLIDFGNQAKGDRKAGVVKVGEEFRIVYSYIALSTSEIFIPWSPTHVDILEEDWMMI